jgi:hypothetical protein
MPLACQIMTKPMDEESMIEIAKGLETIFDFNKINKIPIQGVHNESN